MTTPCLAEQARASGCALAVYTHRMEASQPPARHPRTQPAPHLRLLHHRGQRLAVLPQLHQGATGSLVLLPPTIFGPLRVVLDARCLQRALHVGHEQIAGVDAGIVKALYGLIPLLA